MARARPLRDLRVVVPLLIWTACLVTFIATWHWAWFVAAIGWQTATLSITNVRYPDKDA